MKKIDSNTIKNIVNIIFIILFSMFSINIGVFAQTDVPTRDIIKDIVNEYISEVGAENVQVVGLGSWITGEKYKDPLKNLQSAMSDHDMRIVVPKLPGETTTHYKDRAIRAWEYARCSIIDKVNRRFKVEGLDGLPTKILKSINVYPPDIVIQGIRGSADAVDLFDNTLKTRPNLGKLPVEGLFNDASKGWKQAYESKKGALFYWDPVKNKPMINNTALLHMEEGFGKFTIEGMGSLTDDWIEHLDEALAKKDPTAIKKYLERLDETIKKGKDLGRISHNDYIKNVIKQLEGMKSTDDISEQLMNSIMAVKKRAKYEGQLLRILAGVSEPKEIDLLRSMLEDHPTRWTKTKAFFSEAADKIPVDAIIKGIFIAFDGYKSYDAYIQGDPEKALRDALLSSLSAVATLPETMLYTCINSIIEDSKKDDIAFMVKSQDCQDLLCGICEVKGREGNKIDQRLETNIETVIKEKQPVTASEFNEAILTRLQYLSYLCSNRDLGSATGKVDRQIEQALVDKCLPELRKKWHEQRLKMMGEVAKIETEFSTGIKNGKIQISFEPNPIVIPEGDDKDVKVKFTVNNQIDNKAVGQAFEKMSAIMSLLGGKNKLAYIDIQPKYTWLIDGKPVSTETGLYTTGNQLIYNDSKGVKELTFNKEGNYNVEFQYSVNITFVSGVTDLKYDAVGQMKKGLNMDQEIKLTGSTDVVVTKETPKGSVKIIGPDEVAKGEKFTLKAELSQGLKQSPNIYVRWFDADNKTLTANGEGLEYTTTAPTNKEIQTYTVQVNPSNNEEIGKLLAEINATNTTEHLKIDIIAKDSKQIKLSDKNFTNDAEKAYKEKNWKKLLELLANAETQQAKAPIKNYISKLVADITAENQAQLKALKEFKTANDSAYNNTKEAIKSKYKADLEKCVAKAKEENKDTRFCEIAFVTPDDKKCFEINDEKYFKPNDWAEKDIKFFENLIKKGSDLAPGGQIAENNFAGIDAYTNFSNSAGNQNILIDFFIENDKKALKVNYEIGKPIPAVKYDATCSSSSSILNMDTKKIILKTTNKTPKIGEAVSVSATVEGMKKGAANTHFCTSNFDYEWKGNNLFNPVTKSDPNTTNSIDFVTSKIGTYPVEVKVLCKGEPIGSDTMNITVKGSVTGKISGLDDQVVFGTTKDLSATINMTDSSGNVIEAPKGQYKLLWNSSPNLEYQAQDTTLPNTSVTFNRISNPTRIWADILQNKDGVMEVAGSTNTLDVEVVSPKFIFKYDPPPNQIKIGQPVKVTLVTEPEISLSSMDIRWVEPTDRKEIDKGIIEITPKDSNPIKLHAIARVPSYGDTINENIKDTLTPSNLKVVATVIGPKYNKAVEIFNSKTGTIETTKAYAVHQDILISADVPGMEKNNISFEWSAITPDTHIGAGQFSSEVTVNRSQVGTATVQVVVYDKAKIKLGEATASFDVSVSQEDIDKSKANSKQILEQALKLIQEGKLDEGINLLGETKKQITDNTEINEAYDRYNKEKMQVLKNIEKMKTYLSENMLDKAEQELLEAKKLHPLYQPVIDAEILFRSAKEKYINAQAAKTIDEAKKLDEQGKLDEAITYLANGLKSYPDSTSIKELYEKFRSEKEQIVSNVKQFNLLLAKASTPSDYDEAEKYLDIINNLNHPNYQPVIGANNLWGSRFTYRVQLIYHNLDKAKELVSAGKVDEAITLLEETLISAKKFTKTPKLAQDVQTYLDKVRSDKAICLQQIEKVKAHVSQNNMNEAKTELAVAQGIYPNYPPVIEAAKLIKNQVVIQNDPQQNQNNSVVPLLSNTLNGNNLNNPNTNSGQILTHPGRPAIISNNPGGSSTGQQLTHPGRPAIISNNPGGSSTGQQLTSSGGPAIISNNPATSSNYTQPQVEPGRPAFTNPATSPNYTQPQVEPGRPAFTNPATSPNYTQPQVEPGRPAFTNPATSPNYAQQLNHPGRPALLNNPNMITPQQNMMQSLLEQCQYQYQHGNYEAALQKCNDLLVIYPNAGAKKIVSEIQTKMNPGSTKISSVKTNNNAYQTNTNISKPNYTGLSQNNPNVRPPQTVTPMTIMTTNPAHMNPSQVYTSHVPPIRPVYTNPGKPVQPCSPANCYDGYYQGTVTLDKLTGTITATVSGTNVTGKVNGIYYSTSFQADWSGSVNVANGVVSGKVNFGNIKCFGKELNFTADFQGAIKGNTASGSVNGYSARGNRSACWTVSK